MAFNALSELRPGTNRPWGVRVYVSRLWHHRGGTDTGPIKHTDIVFLDEQGNSIYAEIPDKLVDQFMDTIVEGKVYDVRKFFVFPKKFVFRPVDGPLYIKFTRYTIVAETEGLEAGFPFCTYELTQFDQLAKPSDIPQRFTDVIGVVSAISDVVQYHNASRAEPSIKRIIHIKDQSGNQLAVNLWGETATDFDGAGVKELGKTEPIIVIFVGTLVKTYDGQRALSGSAACRWYINEELRQIMDFRRGLRGQIPDIQHIHLPGQTAAEIDAQVNLGSHTVEGLNSLDIFDNRDARFYCTATLARLSPGQRWWFPSCTLCHKSAAQDGSAYKCSDQKCLGTDALPRYKICFMATDGKEEAEFVFFDRVGRELLGIPLISLLRHGHAPGAALTHVIQAARDDDSIPKEMAAVISRKFRFVVSISNKCYTKEDADISFQVHRIDADVQQQLQTSVFGPGSSSVSASGPSGSSSGITMPPAQTSGMLTKPVSPDLHAYETVSTEDRATILLQNTPPSVTKPPLHSGSTAPVLSRVHKNLFSTKAAVVDPVTDKESLAAKGNEVLPDAHVDSLSDGLATPKDGSVQQDEGEKIGEPPLPEAPSSPQDKKSKRGNKSAPEGAGGLKKNRK